MKVLVIALALIATQPASAQWREFPPKTVPLVNSVTQQPAGTVTYSGRMAFFRDKHGVHFATVETHADGTRTAYDPHGKIIDMRHVPTFK